MLGLLAALRDRGLAVQPFKNGPDYIDPAFHRAASGRWSFNLDSWAMPGAMLDGMLAAAEGADLILAEGSMGLFDGVAAPGACGQRRDGGSGGADGLAGGGGDRRQRSGADGGGGGAGAGAVPAGGAGGGGDPEPDRQPPA